MLANVARYLYTQWMRLPYRWRKRIAVAAVVWVVFRIILYVWGFQQMMLWLLVGLGVAFLLAEFGLRKADAAESWLYGKVTGQFQGIVTGALIPVLFESWGRYISSPVRDELIMALLTTALFVYLVLFMRKSFSLAIESTVKARRRSRAEEK